jgi:hypothetical protein
MNKTSKIIGVIALCLIIILFVYIGFQHSKVNKLESINQLQAVQLSVLNDTVSVYKSKSGELTYKLNSVEIERNNLKESLEIAGYDLKKLKAKDIEWRNIVAALKIQLESTGHGSTELIDTFYVSTIDTFRISNFAWSNNYLSLQGNIKDKTMKFDYRYQTGIDIIQAQKRKSTIVSVSLTDPNAFVTTGNNIVVVSPQVWWQKWWLWGVAGVAAGILITN